MAEISAFQPDMMLWIDETGCDKRSMLRKYGYGIGGKPAHDFVLRVGGKRYYCEYDCYPRRVHQCQRECSNSFC